MLEIVCLIWLWRINGRHALENGHRPGKYRAITLALWFGLEIMGSIIGTMMSLMFRPGEDPLLIALVFGMIGAGTGGFLSYRIAKGAPRGRYGQEEEPEKIDPYWGTRTYSAMKEDVRTEPEAAPAVSENQELLSIPATVRIVEELGGYSGARDSFFLNGQPICSLSPGSEYSFMTSYIKNTVTIGRPQYGADDKEHEVRFVAAENGFAEIHASAGRLIPEKFKNYSRK